MRSATRRKQFAQISLVLRVSPERAQTAVKCSPRSLGLQTNRLTLARNLKFKSRSRSKQGLSLTLAETSQVRARQTRMGCSAPCSALPCPSPSIHPSVKEYLRLCACEHRNPYPPYVGRMRITLTCIPHPLRSKQRLFFLTVPHSSRHPFHMKLELHKEDRQYPPTVYDRRRRKEKS